MGGRVDSAEGDEPPPGAIDAGARDCTGDAIDELEDDVAQPLTSAARPTSASASVQPALGGGVK